GGSLTAGAVGDEASGGLASSGVHAPRAGQAGAGRTQTGATDARAGDTASTRTDVAFDSGDAQYQTQAEVEVPDVGKITGAAGSWSARRSTTGRSVSPRARSSTSARISPRAVRWRMAPSGASTCTTARSGPARWRATSTPSPGGARPGRRRSRRPGIHAGDLLAPRPPEPRQRPLDAPLARNLVPLPPRRRPRHRSPQRSL